MLTLFFNANKALLKDLYLALLLYKTWSTIAMKTMFIKFKRSKLGFFWPFFNSFFFAISISFVFSIILDQSFKVYAPYLISGFIIWNFFSAIISEQTLVITSNSSYLKELNYNFIFYIFKKNYELTFYFIINIFIFVLLSALFFHEISLSIFLLIINILLIIILSIFVSISLSIIQCFFRDFVHIVNNVMRLMFFITPIIWSVEMEEGMRGALSIYNPFYYLLEMIRTPLISSHLINNLYLVYLLLLSFFYLLSLFLYKVFYRKITYYI